MLEWKVAYFGRTSRCRKLTPKPNPRLKNCSKTSQESSAQSGLSSYQYYQSQRLLSEKSEMRIFPNSGDFILIPTYNGSYVKIQFSRQNTDRPFLAKHMWWSHQPTQDNQSYFTVLVVLLVSVLLVSVHFIHPCIALLAFSFSYRSAILSVFDGASLIDTFVYYLVSSSTIQYNERNSQYFLSISTAAGNSILVWSSSKFNKNCTVIDAFVCASIIHRSCVLYCSPLQFPR